MISVDNIQKNNQSSDMDFTVTYYRELILLAKKNYVFSNYGQIPWEKKFVLWRHDCDFSLNRAYALARIEAEEGITATYFVNPHCEFYNLHEKSQHRLVQKILALGHEIGLHFDTAFYETHNEMMLSDQIRGEAAVIEGLFGVMPSAFSFHNPVAFHLGCEAESYGGLVNCYSRRFKEEVPYCSDSNGYWRFRRLWNVLSDQEDPCLQVLTHPGWWQDKPMPPRQRIFRSIYGRAEATMGRNDALLNEYGRHNHAGLTVNLRFLQPLHPRAFVVCDYLWNQGHYVALFVELWRLHERQINQFCKAALSKEWQVPAVDVNAFFEDRSFAIDAWCLFCAVFGSTLKQAAGVDDEQYKDWMSLLNSLTLGRSKASSDQLEEGCVFLCRAIEALVMWGRSQPMAYDGINQLDAIGIPACKTADGSLTDKLEEIADEIPNPPGKRWERFKADMLKVGDDGATQ